MSRYAKWFLGNRKTLTSFIRTDGQTKWGNDVCIHYPGVRIHSYLLPIEWLTFVLLYSLLTLRPPLPGDVRRTIVSCWQRLTEWIFQGNCFHILVTAFKVILRQCDAGTTTAKWAVIQDTSVRNPCCQATLFLLVLNLNWDFSALNWFIYHIEGKKTIQPKDRQTDRLKDRRTDGQTNEWSNCSIFGWLNWVVFIRF